MARNPSSATRRATPAKQIAAAYRNARTLPHAPLQITGADADLASALAAAARAYDKLAGATKSRAAYNAARLKIGPAEANVAKALDALKVGNIGLMGATGTLLEDSLLKLRTLIDRSLPEIRIASGMVTPPPRR